MLIIGCGNLQRGDDGAGIIAAERLRPLGFEVQILSGEAADLIEAWKSRDDVIAIDCVVTGAAVGTVYMWDTQCPLTDGSFAKSTHGFGLGEAMELARALDCLPPRLCVYGIEGRCFDVGGRLSREVQGAIAEVVNRISQTRPALKPL